MSTISTHILDTARGMPARGVRVTLQRSTAEHRWEDLAMGSTNADGRIPDFVPKDVTLTEGIYRMRFDVSAYFSEHKTRSFYPYIEVVFELGNDGHYHVPLLLSPWGFSTYRGS
ncbi:MAG TPA: hydroxyisourate hydrolase [Flavobacteriales bacterium]|nr:hydroxyisourate hydrolase [Flavobacteriales bacterium]